MSKHISTSAYITVDKEIWNINSGFSKQGYPLPIFTGQMTKIVRQLNIMTTKYSRVLVVFFDLHLKTPSANNSIISRFRKLLFRRITTAYYFNQIGFSWCREHEKSKQQHYHMALFLEGRKIRTPEYLYDKIQYAWWFVGGGNVTKTGYNMINKNNWQSKQDAIYHLSYHAKTRSKGYRPKQTKDFGLSRLKIK